MPDARRGSYPMLRGRRRRGRAWPKLSPTVRRAVLALLIVGGALALVLGAVALWPQAPDPAAARAATARAQASLAAGNYSAARSNAQQAIVADPAWVPAHLVLARAYLALGDGLAADAEITRARARGVPAARLHAVAAHAALLQGNEERGRAEAAAAMATEPAYARRIAALIAVQAGDAAGGRRALEVLAADHPQDAAGWTALGRVRLRIGDISGADAAAQRALAIDRRDPELLTLKGEIVRARFGLAASLPWFDAALGRDAFFHPALIEQAATLGEAGRNTEALAATRAALRARPGSPQALYLQAVIAARAGQFDLARAMLAHAGDAASAMPGALLLAGGLDYAEGRHEQAIERWRVLLATQPLNLVVRRLLGAALLRSGDARGALDTLRPLALRPDADVYTLLLVGRAFEATGERDWAARFLDRAAAIAPEPAQGFSSDDSVPVLAADAAEHAGDPMRAVGLVRGLIDSGRTGDALVRAVQLASASPGAPAAHLAHGDTLAALGRWREAALVYARAANLAFDEPTVLRLVDALERTGRAGEAADALALYLSQNPQSVTALRLLAQRQIAVRQWPAAIGTLEHLRHRLGNRDAAVLADLAQAHAAGGDAAAALRYGRAAYALAPANAAAADAFGWSLYQSGDLARSLLVLAKATTLAPAHAGVRWHWAQALAEAGRRPEAAAAIRLALADPRFADRAAATALLRLVA